MTDTITPKPVTSTTFFEDGSFETRTFVPDQPMTLESVTEGTGDPVLDLLFALKIGDTVTVTKDHQARTVTVTAIMDADTSPYILATDHLGPIGFDRATISHGIVEISR
jgi:hypothetical protein